jgi:hypothetical protein
MRARSGVRVTSTAPTPDEAATVGRTSLPVNARPYAGEEDAGSATPDSTAV